MRCQLILKEKREKQSFHTNKKLNLNDWASEVIFQMIWATSQENLFMPYANNKGADQPAHPRILISDFVVRCLDNIIHLVLISEISSFYLFSVAAQAGLGLPWSQTQKTGFLVTWLIWCSAVKYFLLVTYPSIRVTDKMDILYWTINEPAHEIMALFVLRKLIF